MSEHSLDMSPKDLLNEEGVYVLQHKDIYSLLKYTWTGVLLPVTVVKYNQRLDLPFEVASRLSDVISSLVATFVKIQAHCQVFKDITYPRVVALADDIYGYAQLAGGDVTTSSYAIIFHKIEELKQESNSDVVEGLRGTIDGLIDVQLSTIASFTDKSVQLVSSLRTFEDQTKKDQEELKERSDAVRARITEKLGNLDELEDKLEGARRELEEDVKEYEHDTIVAATTPAYAWLGPIGLIAAATTAGIYGSKAVELSNRIDELKALISNSEGKIISEKHIVADLNTISAGINNVILLVEPTCKAIEKMMGTWGAISDDLTNLKRMVDKNVRDAAKAIAPIVAKKTVAKWNDLSASVDKYRETARMTSAEQRTLDDFQAQLRQQAMNEEAQHILAKECLGYPRHHHRPGTVSFA